jgi:hypothetical protein
MDTIRVNISGDRKVELLFEEFPDGLYADLKAEINALSMELFARVEAATPQLTGKLRSEERVRLFADPNRITGYVDIAGTGQDFAKAGALEYGAHRATQVSAHSMRLDHVFGEMLASPMTVMVDAYSRTPDIQAFAFERGPLDAMAPEIVERLNAVVDRVTAETNR